MNRIISMIMLVGLLCSCGVQHFNVNTTDYGENWKVFGENTNGKESMKSGEFFIFGINMKQTDTESMAKQMGATSYTIETKSDILSIILPAVTLGIVSYKRVTVIKRL